MEKISPILLRDTFNLIQLARETARLNGVQTQAERLEPVVDQLKDLVENKQPAQMEGPAPSAGILGQPDFEILLNTSKAEKVADTSQSFSDRNRIVQAMAAGGMNEIDIARQLGMTRGEVKTIISLQPGNSVNWST